MPSIMDLLTQQLGSNTVSDLSRHLGADKTKTESAMAAALPVILSALARNAAKPEGAESLNRALDRDHDGSVLDNLTGFLGQPDEKTGNGILKHVLGARRNSVESGLSQTSGLDPASVGKLLTMLAPLVMGTLGRAKRQQGFDSKGLAEALGSERKQLEQRSPDLGGLAGLLDADGDGQVLDDVMGKVGKGLLGRLFSRR